MSLKIIVTDIQGALGQTLAHELELAQCQLLAPKIHWEDALAVREYLTQHKPDVIINTLAWEELPSPDQQILLPIAAANIANACASLGLPLIHFSSYQVFGVDNKSSHSEKDIPAPVSPAGEAFFAAEQAIEHSAANFIILRLGWIIGSIGNNHLTRLLMAIQGQQAITLNARLRGAPTLLSDAARVCVALVKQIACGSENWGVMHYCSGDALNEAEFGEQLVQLLAQHQLLNHNANFTLIDIPPTNEPLSAVLGCRRIRDTFGVQARPWRPSLLPLVKQWLQSQNG